MIRIDCIVCITSPELPPMAVQNTGHMIQTETPMAVQFAGHFICRRRHVTTGKYTALPLVKVLQSIRIILSIISNQMQNKN